MANVKVEKIGGKDPLAAAKAFYKAGFQALDATRKGDATVTVSANDLIDIMISFEAALKGETGDMMWALAVESSRSKGAVEILEKARDNRWNKGDFDSKAAELYATDPYPMIMKRDGEESVIANGKAAYLAICKATDEQQ